MADYIPYTQRLRTLETEGQPVPLNYENLPKGFRNQVIAILDDVIGITKPRTGISSFPSNTYQRPHPWDIWEVIWRRIAREQGFPSVDERIFDGRALFTSVFTASNLRTRQALEQIEIAFRIVSKVGPVIDTYKSDYRVLSSPEDGLRELNRRFAQHELGYRFDSESGLIARLDSEYLHGETVDPALTLLRQQSFAGAEQEFLEAQRKFRVQDYEGSMVEALKAFESTMKQICDERGWTYGPAVGAKELTRILVDQDFFPKPLESALGSVRSLLESALPTARNRFAGHGQGSSPRNVPECLAAFALHQAAANIVLLVGLHLANSAGSGQP